MLLVKVTIIALYKEIKMNIIQYIKKAAGEIAFPKVCYICGIILPDKQHFLCHNCIKTKFEEAYISSEEKINRPESVVDRVALWQFDKGGELQNILHGLKYKRLTDIGIDLGAALGRKLKKRYKNTIPNKELMLLPVPLHTKRNRKRGYNQAEFIVEGVKAMFGGTIIPIDAVLRVKNTKTQTGFSLEKRRSNISGAFVVKKPEWISEKAVFIIDDVFTTGATGYELAHILKQSGAKSVYIATVAQA